MDEMQKGRDVMSQLLTERKDYNNDNWVKVAALSIIILQYGTSLTTPALGAMALAFPDVSQEMIKQVQSLPSLIAIPAAFLCAVFERFMSKRTMILLAAGCTFAGILPAIFSESFNFILFTRVIFGFGRGMVFTMASSYIADLFSGETRDKIMGWKTTVGSVSGSLFQLLGGALAIISWTYSFAAFLVLLPVILLLFFKLPEPDVKPVPLKETGGKLPLSTTMWFITIVIIFFQICQFSFMTNMAIVIATEKIANPGVTGAVMTTFTIGMAIGAAIYGSFTKKVLKNLTLGVSVALLGIAFLILVNTNDIQMFFVAAFIYGLGFGTFNPDIILTIVKSVPKTSATMALSIFVAFQNFGQFLSPIVLALITGWLGIEGSKAGWTVAGPTLLVAGIVVAIAMGIAMRNKKEQDLSQAS
jgi:MFS family permease